MTAAALTGMVSRMSAIRGASATATTFRALTLRSLDRALTFKKVQVPTTFTASRFFSATGSSSSPASVMPSFDHKSTPDLCDEYEDTIRVLDPIFRNYGGKQRFSGTAVTVKCHEDNSKIKQLAKTQGNGRVIVVDGGGSRRRALLGDQVALDAMQHGWSGLVLYGSIRDVDEIGALQDLGVQALGTHPIKTIKRDEGQVDVPVTFAGVTIRPGDFVACDNNGIVVNDTPMDVELK